MDFALLDNGALEPVSLSIIGTNLGCDKGYNIGESTKNVFKKQEKT